MAGAEALLALILVALVVGAYFLPTIVGIVRKVPNIGSVVVINFFLGWTLVGWVVSLAMAFRSAPGPNTVAVNVAPSVAVSPLAAPQTDTPAAKWATDPTGRHELRYWDGERWTEHVSDESVTSRDPM